MYDLDLRPDLNTLAVYGIIRMEFKVYSYYLLGICLLIIFFNDWVRNATKHIKYFVSSYQVTEQTDFIVFHMKGMNITMKTINEKLKIQRYSPSYQSLHIDRVELAEY